MKFKCLLIIAICLIINGHLSAQTNNLNISGTVIDSVVKKPLGYLTVRLQTKIDSTLKTVITKDNGSFLFENIAGGEYTVSITGIGYRSVLIPVNITATAERLMDLGIITLSTDKKLLKEVIIAASRPIIRQEVDRIVYDVQADPETKVLSALDIMRKVPLLSLDADDNILLRGNAGYRILINGRVSGMLVKNPKDILRSMPASTIEKIEVITSPPAKYDSEGLAGIINIVTNKKIADGYNASINVNYRAPVGGPGTGSTFTSKFGKLGISAFGGIAFFNTPENLDGSSRISKGSDPSSLTQDNVSTNDRTNSYFGNELSFEIDSLNLITASINFNSGIQDVIGDRLSTLSDQNDNVLQRFRHINSGQSKWGGHTLGLNYQLEFRKKKDHLLTFSYRYNYSYSGMDRELKASERINYNVPDYQQHNNGEFTEQTVQVDHVYPVRKNFIIEAGVKGIFRINKSDFQYRSFNAGSGKFETDPMRTNIFRNNQVVSGAYNSYQYSVNNWAVKAGIRLERTIIDANFIDQSYTNLFPSISLNRKFKNGSNMNFGFTQRVQRPNINNLNPFVDSTNPAFESTGNPELRPVLANNLELGYSKFKKGSVNIGLSYSFSNNTIQQVYIYNHAAHITRSTFLNIGKDRSLTSNFNISYPFTSKWDFSMNGILGYIWLKGLIDNSPASNEGIRGSFRAGTGYKFANSLRINSSFNYNGAFITLQGQSTSTKSLSFSVSKGIQNDKLTFSASVNNPFGKYTRYVNQTSGNNFNQSNTYRFYYRGYNASLNYRFGKLKESIRKNKRNINNDDSVQ